MISANPSSEEGQTFEEKRRQMVRTQLMSRDIVDEKVLCAMAKVPRHEFLPEELWDRAYDDTPLPIGEDQTISQPYIVAYMIQALSLKKGDRVLEVGTGSGYQTALLAEIHEEIYTVEVRPQLAQKALAKLNELGYGDRVKIHIADGSLGYEEEAPFDGIIVAAATFNIPEQLIDQLAENGKIIIPIGGRELQTLVRATKIDGKLTEEELFKCMFVPLVRKDFENN
ncbi:MAG: Protein-L-isoaspartate O-methyltransferase [Candidatus Scalindua arabica]|uniref:Protein-L-isoaspartate O-methyltransferase n=1 Tax=Candidatus Scalindua arabica TaxID=1127984 RepID=A0A941W2K0_9BACT|nr:Protein-L-isoaspartate O-methyltransferase [Candidatus Scalindua arabica]